jgi:hypothetical protein
MCSNVRPSGRAVRPEADVAARLAAAIDELAAAAGTDQDSAESDLAQRLARAWSIITAADPELAARTARYSRS